MSGLQNCEAHYKFVDNQEPRRNSQPFVCSLGVNSLALYLQVIYICICLVQQLSAGLVCLSSSFLGSARSTVTISELPDSNDSAGATTCIVNQQVNRCMCAGCLAVQTANKSLNKVQKLTCNLLVSCSEHV